MSNLGLDEAQTNTASLVSNTSSNKIPADTASLLDNRKKFSPQKTQKPDEEKKGEEGGNKGRGTRKSERLKSKSRS